MIISDVLTKELFKKDSNEEPILPPSFTQCFMEVIRMCKDSITKVNCPVCIVHGNKDDVISYKSSQNIFDLIPHDKKRLFIIHNGKHKMMAQKECSYEIYQLFSLFMDKIILP